MSELSKPSSVINEQYHLPKDSLAQTAYQTQKKDNLWTLINNIKIYCSLLIEHQQDESQVSKFQQLIMNQIEHVWNQQSLQDFRILVDNAKNFIEGYSLYKNLSNFEEVCRELDKLKLQAQNQQALEKVEAIIQGFLDQIRQIINDPTKTIDQFNQYDVYKYTEHLESAHEQNKNTIVKFDHHDRELINTKIEYVPSVFSWVKPHLHQVYVSQSSTVYNEVAPIRIKNIMPHFAQSPTINIRNYFSDDIQEGKDILAYCIPHTKTLGFYYMSDICKLLTMEKEYYHERTLNNQWSFSEYTRSITTPSGKIYAIGCRTTKQKIDSCMYEITDVKASNRGPLPNPKRQSSFIYMNGYLYVIGGYGQGQKCSKRNYRYSLKDKKWTLIAQSNVALKKPTLCTLNNRYLIKMGGLNEFDYINKVIQIYDPLTDKWALVRANPKNIMEEVQILQDSLAVQINDDQVYVFGGKNSNKFRSDKGFILQINQIRERRKGAAKVTGQLWNVSIGKRNLLTLSGSYSPSNVIIHYNCIYLLRVKYSEALSI